MTAFASMALSAACGEEPALEDGAPNPTCAGEFGCPPCDVGFEERAGACQPVHGASVFTADPAGSQASSKSGQFTLAVPAGAVERPTRLIMVEGMAAPGGVPDDLRQLGTGLRLQPERSTFDPPLRLTARYSQGDMLEGGFEEQSLDVLYLRANAEPELATVVERRPEDNLIEVEIPHFSYVVIARAAVREVATGTVTNAASIRRVNQRIARAVRELGNDALVRKRHPMMPMTPGRVTRPLGPKPSPTSCAPGCSRSGSHG